MFLTYLSHNWQTIASVPTRNAGTFTIVMAWRADTIYQQLWKKEGFTSRYFHKFWFTTARGNRTLKWKKNGALRWRILLGKSEHNEQKVY